MSFDRKELARKNVKVTGYAIIFCVTLLSVISTYSIMRGGWRDHGETLSKIIGVVVVLVIEGTFLWLLRGFAHAFSEMMERALCLLGLAFYGAVMIVNIMIHYRIAKGYGLNDFEQGYVSWGAPLIIGVTLVLVTLINLADPKARQLRQELRIQGRQTAAIWSAREMALDSERVARGIEDRAAIEAEEMYLGLLGDGSGRLSTPQAAYFKKPQGK